MFDLVSGVATSVSSSGLVDTSQKWVIDFYKNWIITINSVEYTILGNTETALDFSNALVGTPTYKITFTTLPMITGIESDMGNVQKVPATLYLQKEVMTKRFFEQKIKAKFRNLYLAYDNIDPLTLIYNLYEIQIAYCYYLIAQIYFDLIIEPGDTNELKYIAYMKNFKAIFDDSIELLAVDVDESGSISNKELAASSGSGSLLSR